MAKLKKVPHDHVMTKASSVGLYLARQAHIDEAEKVGVEMDRKWGCDRLRLLVDPELRERFDRQRYLYNQALWHGELEDLRREATRMVTAWQVLDGKAGELGAKPVPDKIIEAAMADGTVMAICADLPAVKLVSPDGRQMRVYLVEEIVRLVEGFPALAKIKEAFEGAKVVAARPRVEDPLMIFTDSRTPIDDDVILIPHLEAGE